MRILLTNDDGINHPNLKALANRLVPEHEVWVIAPDFERSACSHSITLHGALIVKKESERWYSCSGTPADCVLLALKGFIPVEFDMVLSGLNPGVNLGSDIIYSGTAAGARQAAFMGKPSAALSMQTDRRPASLGHILEFISINLDRFSDMWIRGYFLNINFPLCCSPDSRAEITTPSVRIYHDNLTRFEGPDSRAYCFITGDDPGAVEEEGSDYHAVQKGIISVSLISTNLLSVKNNSLSEKAALLQSHHIRKGERA